MKKFLLTLTTAMMLTACASGPTLTADDAKAAIAAAEQETKRATKVDFAWRDTGKIIKKAKEALKKGDNTTAVKLANQAKRQSTNALLQYEASKNLKL